MKTFCFIPLLLLCLHLNATIYYIAANGNDSNNGTSQATPWKSISKINNSKFSPGDFILLRRGDQWREQLTIPSSGVAGNPITIGAYGSGPKPILNGADIITGWTSVGADQWVVNSPNATSSRAMVIIAGQIYSEVASLSAVNSPNKYFIDVAASPDKLYIYSKADPNTLVSEVSKRDYGILSRDVDLRHHINISNIECRYAGGGGLVLDGTQNSHFGGFITVDSCHFYANRTVGCMTRDGHDNDVFKNSTATYNGNGFYTWISDNNVMQNCSTAHTIVYTIAPGTTDGGALQNFKGKNWLVEYCYSDDDNDAIHIDASGVSADAIIRYNKVFNSRFGYPNTPGIGVGSLGAGATVEIYYNLVVNCASNGFESYTVSNGKVLLYNNTIVLKSGTGVEGSVFLKYGNNFVFKNNIIARLGNDNKTLMQVLGGGLPSSDYNHYYQVSPGAYRFFYNGNYYTDLTAWKTTGLDSYSQTGDPKFVNISSDWRLQAGSPAINKGTDVGLTKDISGNTISGLPDMGAFEFTSTVANASPLSDAGPNQVIVLPVNSSTLKGSGSDPDGSVSGYQWTKISGPSAFMLSNAGSSTASVSDLVEGVYKFILTVSDNSGATDIDTMLVDVRAPANLPPVANAGTNQNLTLPSNTLTLKGTGTDTDGTIISYSWVKQSGPAGPTLVNNNSATATVSNLVIGNYVFRLTVKDNNGSTAYDDVQVLVVDAPPLPNLAPVANSGNDKTIILPVNQTTLNGAATDPDGVVEDYTWSKISGPSGGSIQSPDDNSTQVLSLVEGSYVFRLTVTDDDGAVSKDDVNVSVRAAAPAPNQPPVANSGNQITITLPVNEVNLTGSGTDVDGTITQYLWSKVSGPATGTIGTPNSATTLVSSLSTGTYIFRLTVTDDDGAVSSDDVNVTVRAAAPPPNQPPVANSGNQITVTLPVNEVNLAGSGTDVDGTITQYSWSKISGPATAKIQSANSAATLVSSLSEGTYIFRLTVTDNDGAEATDDIQVIVKPIIIAPPPPNQPPLANAGDDNQLTMPVSQLRLDGSASSDLDGRIASYKWNIIKAPGQTGNLVNEDSVIATFINPAKGLYQFELVVTDNQGTTSHDTVSFLIVQSNVEPILVTKDTIIVDLPVRNVMLDASQSYDPDGVIKTYEWVRVSGPQSHTFLSQDSSRTIVTDLVAGTYTFKVTIIDDNDIPVSGNVYVKVRNLSSRKLIPVINLYPNPTKEKVSIVIDSEIEGRTDITLFGISGNTIWKQVVWKNSREFKSIIDVSNLATGMYLIAIAMERSEIAVRKIIKQ